MAENLPKQGRLDGFVEDDEAGVTIEFVLWMPLFISVMAVVMDVSLIFNTQAQMSSLAYDTTRRISLGQLTTPSEAEEFAQARGVFQGEPVTVNAVTSGETVSTELTIPMSTVEFFGIIGRWSDAHIRATSYQLAEVVQ